MSDQQSKTISQASERNKSASNKAIWLFIAVSICLLPYFFLCAYVQPGGDDFFYSAYFRSMSFTEYMNVFLTDLNGRYFAVLLAGIKPLTFGSINGMKLIPLLTLGGIFASIRTMIVLSTGERSFRMAWLWPSLAMLLLLQAFPSTAEGIYWVDGSINHTWASILIIFMVALITVDPKRNLIRGLLGSFIVILIPGMNEIAALVLGIFLLSHAYNTLYSTASRRAWAITWLALLLIGVGISTMLPGSWQRSEALGDNFNFAYSFTRAFTLSAFIAGLQLQQIPLLLISVIMIPILSKVSVPAWDHCRLSKIHWVILLVGSMVIIYLAYFFALLLLGSYPPYRLHNSIAFAFLGLWFLNLYHFAKTVRIPQLPIWASIPLTILALWFIVSDFRLKDPREDIVFRGNTAHCAYDLLVNGPAFQKQMDERYMAILESNTSDTVLVDKLIAPPLSLLHQDITEDPGALYNVRMAYYFNVAAIRIKSENE